MKQKLFAALFLCTLGLQGALSAQDYIPLVINPKVGVNFSDLIIADEARIQTSSQMGWNAGFDFRYGTKLLLMGGMHVYSQGSGVESIDSSRSTMSTFRTSQLKVPFGVGYKIFRMDYFNVWLYANGLINFSLESLTHEGWPEKLDEFRRSSISSRFGLGFDISRITVEINYERSISDFIQDDLNAKNHLVSVAVGFKI